MEWISVKDRFPDTYADVIIYFCKDWQNGKPWFVHHGYYLGEKEFQSEVGKVNPTHWMPLPEPPNV